MTVFIIVNKKRQPTGVDDDDDDRNDAGTVKDMQVRYEEIISSVACKG